MSLHLNPESLLRHITLQLLQSPLHLTGPTPLPGYVQWAFIVSGQHRHIIDHFLQFRPRQ
jgi:hypothetical protein